MSEHAKNIERLLDVEMGVTVRFGATRIPLREVVHLGSGSMIELNRMVDEPVELLVNNYPFARGEVVVIDGYYSVKITEIESPEKRSRSFFSKSAAGSVADAPAETRSGPGKPANRPEAAKPAPAEKTARPPAAGDAAGNQTQYPIQGDQPKDEKEV